MASFQRNLVLALLALLHIQTAFAQVYGYGNYYNPGPPTIPTVSKTQAVAVETKSLSPMRIPCPMSRPTSMTMTTTQPTITSTTVTQNTNTVTVTQTNGGGGGSGNQGTITITLFDANNNPLKNVIVNVLDTNGNIVWAGTTNGNGEVTITLAPGKYILAPQWPDGLKPASPNDRFTFEIVPGQTLTITHVFDVTPSTLGIVTISVKDSNGAPMPGVSVQIASVAGNQVQGVITNSEGMAQVSLPAGQYVVKPIMPNYPGTLSHNLSVTSNERQIITFIVPNVPVPIKVNNGTISGNVYNDMNLNGQVDAGEGIGAVPVTIYSSNGEQMKSVTNANGYYRIEGLSPNTYNIVVGEIPGIQVALEARTRTVQLGVGATIIFNVQLVNVPSTTLPIPIAPTSRPGAIVARVFFDTNWNQQFDNNELPRADVPIALLNSNLNFIASDRTSAAGLVQFQNVPMGTYTVMADLRDVNEVGVTSVEGVVEMKNSGERFFIDFAIQTYNGTIATVKSASRSEVAY